MATSPMTPNLLASASTAISPRVWRTIARSTPARPMLGVVTPSSRLTPSAPRMKRLAWKVETASMASGPSSVLDRDR